MNPQIVPTGFREADLVLKIDDGPRYRVHEVRFTGDLGVDPQSVRRAMRATRIRRVLAWHLHPAFSRRAVDRDVAQLRSFYAARGYFAARIAGSQQFAGSDVSITFSIDAGPRSSVRAVQVASQQIAAASKGVSGEFPAREVCRCLLHARRQAERSGHPDFHARLELDAAPAPPGLPSAAPWVRLTARTDPGPAYMVGRIEFRGNHALGDATLRRAMLLQEGEPFDRGRLRRSVARLNRLGLFTPLAERDITVQPTAVAGQVNLTLSLRQTPRGRWSLTGPLAPSGLNGAFEAAISSRLPGWGRGVFEASTYYATLSVFGLPSPVLRALLNTSSAAALPLAALDRPYLPGETWLSGFSLSPQLGARGMLATYAMTHVDEAIRSALAPDRSPAPPLEVPITRAGGEISSMLACEARSSRLAWFRSAGVFATDWLLAPRLF